MVVVVGRGRRCQCMDAPRTPLQVLPYALTHIRDHFLPVNVSSIIELVVGRLAALAIFVAVAAFNAVLVFGASALEGLQTAVGARAEARGQRVGDLHKGGEIAIVLAVCGGRRMTGT